MQTECKVKNHVLVCLLLWWKELNNFEIFKIYSRAHADVEGEKWETTVLRPCLLHVLIFYWL
jgi:hypothetical protein